MRTTHKTVALCVLALAGGPVMLAHCSGSSTSNGPGKDGGSQGSSGGGGSSNGGGTSSGTASSSGGSGDDGGGSSSGITTSSGGSSSGSSSDGGTGSSGGGEGGTGSSSGSTAVPEGGAPPDPGSITCGSSTCTTTSQRCCTTADAGTCEALNAGSCPTGSVEHSCNETADCASGSYCCAGYTYGGGASCHIGPCSETVGGTYQVCRTDSECGSADAGAASQKCIVQTCYTNQYMTTTVMVEACAVPQAAGGTPGGNPGGFPGGGTPGGGGTTYGPLVGCH